MIPLVVDGFNAVLVAPKNAPDVLDLHVRMENRSGVMVFVSRWEPTLEELSVLVAGGSVELSVMGVQPPVFLIAAKRPE